MDPYIEAAQRPEETTICQLCERQRSLSFHHLIPRTVHSNKWFKKNFDREQMTRSGVMVCRDCHRLIHRTFSAKELGREYNTLQLLRAHITITAYISWVQRRQR